MPFNNEIFWSVLEALLAYGLCKSVLADIVTLIFNKITGR